VYSTSGHLGDDTPLSSPPGGGEEGSRGAGAFGDGEGVEGPLQAEEGADEAPEGLGVPWVTGKRHGAAGS